MTDVDIDYAHLFKQMPVPRMIVRPEDGGVYRVIKANDLAIRFFNDQKIEGLSISAFMDSENLRQFEQSFAVCASRKKNVSMQSLPSVPGQRLTVFGFWVSPVLGKKGELLFLDVVGQMDARDQSALQRERDDAISLLASIFEVSEVGIVVTDPVGNIVRVNEHFIRSFGWNRDELMSFHLTDVVAPQERERARINHKKYISVGVRSSGEMRVLKKDGNIANTLFTSATLRLSQNRKFLVTTVVDITLRKQMEHSLRMAKDQADAANRAKSTFLANMSHELRTPLNAIIGFSELILKNTFGPIGSPKYAEYLTDIHMSAEHLLEIINEVLDMSKIEAGRLELYEELFSVEDVAESVVRMMASRIFSNDITIEAHIQPNLPNLYADNRLVRQILINILSNSVKFSKSKGVIRLETEMLEDGRLQIRIRDQGIGIEQHKMARVLEPFGQVNDQPEHRGQEGTGLGLPLAKAMMELHGGRLLIASEPGIGTTVSLNFPKERVIFPDSHQT